MTGFSRYAVYFLPRGALAEFGAAWLGWDVAAGRAVPHCAVPGLAEAVAVPRRYGFHATLKPPFALAPGQTAAALGQAVQALASGLAPAQTDGLEVARLGRFLALVPRGCVSGLSRVAEACVRDLDAFRAPLTEQDLQRRRKPGLSPEQEALLMRWGYPQVMQAFRFHMTLTGRLAKPQLQQMQEALARHLPPLPGPFVLDDIALVGEGKDGLFRLIRRYPLSAGA